MQGMGHWGLQIHRISARAVLVGALALIAFGLDSLVEIFASALVLWYIGNHHAERRAMHALRLVAVAFAALGVYARSERVQPETG